MTEVMKMRRRQYAYYRDLLFTTLKGENSPVGSMGKTEEGSHGTL